MAHAQQQILDALQIILAAGSTVASTRVFVDRVDPLQADELPAILIDEDADGEASEISTVADWEQRTLAVQVTCVLADSTTAAAEARDFGLAVEKLIATSATMTTLAKMGYRITASRQANVGSGDRLFGARQQSWQFSYLVAADEPDVII